MQDICIRYTEPRAGVARSALLQEVALYTLLLLWRLALELLDPTAAVCVTLGYPCFADANEAAFDSPIGIWKDAAELEDVVSGVVPERR